MIILYGLCLLHFLFFLILRKKWNRIKETDSMGGFSEDLPGVTVLVPVRNEQNKITDLLRDLQNQNYPNDRLEVIVIDDHCEDNTSDIVRRFNWQNIHVLELPEHVEGKKAATSAGIQQAQHDIILCTDGDCRMNSTWVRSTVDFMLRKDLKMVTGPVLMEGDSLFQRMQAMEFSGLIAFGAVTLADGSPGMCNGANLAYQKSAFEEVDGYAGNRHIPSGDDEFLLQKIHKSFPGRIAFNKSIHAIVRTQAKSSFNELLSQRRRWVSKWKFHKSSFIKLTAVLTFLDFAVGLMLYPLLFLVNPWLILGAFLIRLCGEMIYLSSTGSYFRIPFRLTPIIVLGFIYPLYAVFLGIASIFGSYTWKGRKYG